MIRSANKLNRKDAYEREGLTLQWPNRFHTVGETRKRQTAKLPRWMKRLFRLVFGYQRAYEKCYAQLTLVRDERDRVLRSLEKLRVGKATLPTRLAGRQLCFMHIGKTAGTSVQHALFEAMHDTAIFQESLPNFDRATAAELAINDLVIGHFMHQHVANLRSDRFLITFLRDPVERVISSYYFLRSRSPVESYSKGAIEAAKALTLNEFLLCQDPSVRMITENFQAKALAYDVRPEHQGAISDLQGEAERNLSTFDFIGIVEYFDESMAALSQAIGADLAIKMLNSDDARSSKSAPSPSEIALIRQLNVVDIFLYAKAKDWFERTVLPSHKPHMITIPDNPGITIGLLDDDRFHRNNRHVVVPVGPPADERRSESNNRTSFGQRDLPKLVRRRER